MSKIPITSLTDVISLQLHHPCQKGTDLFLPDGNGVDLVLAIKKAAPNRCV